MTNLNEEIDVLDEVENGFTHQKGVGGEPKRRNGSHNYFARTRSCTNMNRYVPTSIVSTTKSFQLHRCIYSDACDQRAVT